MKALVVATLMISLLFVGCGKSNGSSSPTPSTPSPVVDEKEATLKEKIFQAEQQLTIHNNRASEAKSRSDHNTTLAELQMSIKFIQERDTTQMELAEHYKDSDRKSEAANLYRAVYKSCGENNPLGQKARNELLSMHEKLE